MTLTGAGADDMAVEAVVITAARRGNDAEASALMDCDDVSDESGAPWDSVPEMPDAVRTVVHGTRITVTSTGAGDDAMGDTIDRQGDDADAGAHMDCDDDGEGGGEPWVTVP